MQTLIRYIDRINRWFGFVAAGCVLLLVCIVCVDVILRSLFNQTANWVIELEWHVFALIFLFGVGHALQHDRHVRVDLFYERFSVKDRSLVDLLGSLLFLLPWCASVLFAGSQYAYQSFADQEVSDTPGGLPYRYLIKSAIVVGFLLLFLQGIGQLLKSWRTYRMGEPEASLHSPTP